MRFSFGIRRLNLRDYKRFAKFAVVGFSGAIVNLLIFEICMFLFSALADSPRILISNSIGIFVSIFTNFLLNDRWTWGDRNKVFFFKRLIKFYAAASFAAGVQLTMTWASITYFWSTLPLVFGNHNFSPTLGLMTGIASGMFINFATSHFWAFKDES